MSLNIIYGILKHELENQDQRKLQARTDIKKIALRVVNTVVAIGLGAFLVYYLLSNIGVEDIKEAFLSMYLPPLILFIIINFSDTFFRAYRYHILVGSPRARMRDMFFTSLIRNAFNMILPARTGELTYVYVLNRKFKFPVEVGVSTLIVALVFDLVIVFSLIVISIIIVGINRFFISSTLVLTIVIGLLLFILLFLFYLSRIIGFFLNIFSKILNKSRTGGGRVLQVVYRKLVDINQNIEIIQKRKIYSKVYFSSLAIRVMKFTSYYFLVYAVMKPMGYTLSDLPYWVVLLGTVAAEISGVLPTHSVAGLGTYEGAFTLAFVLLGFTQEISIIVGFTYHITLLIFSGTLGLISLIIISMPFYRIKEEKEEKD